MGTFFQIRVATDFQATCGLECPDHIDMNMFLAHVSEHVHTESTEDTIFVALRYDADAREVSIFQCPKGTLRTLLEHIPDGPVYIYVDATFASKTMSLCTSDDVPEGARFPMSVLLSMI